MGSTVLLFWVVSTILAVAGYIFLKKNYLSQHPEHEQFGVGVLFGLPIFQIWITANICLPFVFVLPAQDDIVGQLTSDFDMINMTHEQWEGLYTVRDFMVIIFLVLAAFSAYALYGAYKREGFTAKKLKTATLIISCLYIIPIIGLIIFGFTIGQYFPINLILVIAAMILLQKKYNTVVENVFSVIQPSTPIQPKPEKTTPTPIKNEKSPEPTKRCPNCGEEILAVAKKCKHCGEWIKEEPKEMVRCSVCGEKVEKGLQRCPICNEPLHASHLALDIEETTKPCMSCGEPILEIAKKCKHCGEWQRKPKEFIACPICGEKVEKGLETCPYCHEPLTETPKTETKQCPICGEDIPADSKVCPECNESIE